MSTQQLPLLSPEEFKAALFAIGKERYHHRHPFHLLMHEGKLHAGSYRHGS